MPAQCLSAKPKGQWPGPAVPICLMHTETKAPASRRRHAGPVLPALYALYGPDAGGALGWIGV